MKALFIHSFLITTLLTLVGCGSKENAVSLEVTSSFAVSAAGYSGGLVVSGKNAIGQRFVKTVFGGTSLKVVLPDGAWDLSVVGWDGASPYNGVPYCGKSSINLSGTDASATVTVNAANCLSADFSGSTFISAANAEIHPLKIVTCGSFYEHASESSFTKLTTSNHDSYSSSFCEIPEHPMDLRSRTKSIKLIPIDKNFNGVYSGQPGNNPVCVSEMPAHNGIFNLTQQIPIAGLPVQIAFYEDSACQKQSSFVLFPDGLKDGYSAKFDSIFGNIASDGLAPITANRLIVSDNGINRGWSPFYAQMPFFKCSTGFCGDFVPDNSSANSKYSDAIFDYFMEVDYAANVPQSLTFPASSDICSSVTVPGTVTDNRLVIHETSPGVKACSFSQGQITVLVKPKMDGSFCTGQLSNTCSSPTYKFVLDVNGVEKEIYFSGKKDYAGAVEPVPFSHLYVPVKQYTVASTCGTQGTDWLPYVGETNNVLAPEYLCVDPAATLPVLLAKPFYNSSNKSFKVDDSGTYYGKIQFEDNISDTAQYVNLLMLPPDAREQRNLTNVIFEAIGGTGWMESFKYENNYYNDYEDESRAYGSIRKPREMLSPDGPGGLFGDSVLEDACLTTVGTKQIRHTDRDGTHDYEITITNISASSSDTSHVRQNAYCNDTDFISPITCSTLNSGKYQKAMQIKKDGVPTEVVLFDCAVDGSPGVPTQNGRLEAVYNDVEDGKYRREKEVMYWNTYNQQYARFEKYSRSMESSTSDFAIKTYDERKFEKIFKASNELDRVQGRIYKYSTHSNPNSQNLTAARFQLYRPPTFSDWHYSYAFYDFHEPLATNFFSDSAYSSLKTETFADTHFCGLVFSYPQTFAYNRNCANLQNSATPTFVDLNLGIVTEPLAVHEPFTSYQYIKPTNFDPIMKTGYFPVSWP